MNLPEVPLNEEQTCEVPGDRLADPPLSSAQVPESLDRFLEIHSLSAAHLSDLSRSGITKEQALAAGIRSVLDPRLIGRILRWHGPANKLGSCICFTFRNPDGSLVPDYFRLKPDKPRVESNGRGRAKTIKYESPVGRPNRAYFPPGVPAVLADAAVPLVVTEGEKKALKATLEGFDAVGLVGIWGWHQKRPRDNQGQGVGDRKLIPDLEVVKWSGREVAIVFDSDAARKPDIQFAESALADVLTHLGARVRIVRLPDLPSQDESPAAKCGLDDYLVSKGPQALHELIAATGSYVRQDSSPKWVATEHHDTGNCPKFRIGDRVRPSDRKNVGTVVGDVGGNQYQVLFVGRQGEAEKTFHARDLSPYGRGPGRLVRAGPPTGPPPPWIPFPLDGLPEIIRDYCVIAAASLGADPAFVVVPVLAAAAGAIGNSRALVIKAGWAEPAILWTAIIAEPGGAKSPALRHAFRPLWDRQLEYQAKYSRACGGWESEKSAAKRGKREPNAALQPRLRHILVDDITTEALGERLADNPRGLVCQPDELRKWIASFDRYRSGKGGSDRPFWLSAHDGHPTKIDRKTPDRPCIIVPRATVSLSGGVQPIVWETEVCNEEADLDGLAARLLHAMPPDGGGGWSDVEVGPAVLQPYAARMNDLLGLDLTAGEPVPIPLSAGAKQLFMSLTDSIVEQRRLADDWERPILAKLNKHAARVALVLQLADDPRSADVTERWMAAGIQIARWFHDEAFRVRVALGTDPDEAHLDRLERAADANNGRLAPRDLIERNRRRYPDAATATAALDQLVRRRPNRWKRVEKPPGPQGGRPSSWIERVQPPDEPDQDSTDQVSTTSETLTPVPPPPSDIGCAGFAGGP